MTIKRWNYTDIKAVADLQEKCFKDAWSYKMLADAFLNEKFYGYLAEENGVVIACSAFVVNYDDADLVNILVDRPNRRTGVAKALMDEMLKECQKIGLKEIFLEVRESNFPAIKLYNKYGFKKVSTREKYYKDGETANVMKKEFSYNTSSQGKV